MAVKYRSRVYSSFKTTHFHQSMSFLRPAASRGLATNFKLEGIDFGSDGKHWLETRSSTAISKFYLLCLEARKRLGSTRHYYAIGALIDEEICSKLRGEPFIDGRPVPYK